MILESPGRCPGLICLSPLGSPEIPDELFFGWTRGILTVNAAQIKGGLVVTAMRPSSQTCMSCTPTCLANSETWLTCAYS